MNSRHFLLVRVVTLTWSMSLSLMRQMIITEWDRNKEKVYREQGYSSLPRYSGCLVRRMAS